MMKKNQISAVHSARQNSPPLSVLRTLYLIPFLLLFGGCELLDPEPGLPPVTSTGEGTFGCMVNGKLWLPYKEKKWFAIDAIDLEVYQDRFSIGVMKQQDEIERMSLHVRHRSVKTDSLYVFNSEVKGENITTLLTSINSCQYGGIEKHGEPDNYTYVGYSHGWIKFSSYDIPGRGENRKGVIAGEFGFTSYPVSRQGLENCIGLSHTYDSIVVTQGRFDIEVP